MKIRLAGEVYSYVPNKCLAWPDSTDKIVLEELLDTENPYEAAFKRLRELHPKLKSEAIRKRLQPSVREHDSIWATSSFWKRELDIVLIGGVLGGFDARRAAVERIHKLWPRLDLEMLQGHLEALADHGTPAWSKPDFWEGTLRQILLEGVVGGIEAERKAMTKILRLYPDLRSGVVAAQLRRVRDAHRRAESHYDPRFLWTKQLVNQLREDCKLMGTPAAVDHMQARTGWPTEVVWRKAQQLVDSDQGKRQTTGWAASEQRYLIEHAGHMSTRNMAQELQRSVESVACKMKRLGLTTAREEGFTISNLATDWHVRRATVRGWISLGWLKRGRDGRIPERVVRSFCKKHRDELNWTRLEAHTRAWVLEFCHQEEEPAEVGGLAENQRRSGPSLV